MTQELVVIGGGGHARVLIEVLSRAGRRPIGVVDSDPGVRGREINGVPVIGDDSAILRRGADEVLLVNGLGNRTSHGTSGLEKRRAIFESFKARGYAFASVISPDAVLSSDLELAEGLQVMAGAIVQPGVRIGCNTIVNTGAIVEHDCEIGAHCHVAPGAVLCGGVSVGDESHIGAGATVIQGIDIGAGAVIAAGVVVSRDLARGQTAGR